MPVAPPPTQAEYNRVHKIVRSLLPPSYDREFLADGIVIHSWRNGITVTPFTFIRNKCSNAFRDREVELKRNQELSLRPLSERNETHDAQRRIFVSELVSTELTSTERMLVHMRFWQGLTIEEIAADTRQPRKTVQDKLHTAIYKMKVALI